MYIINLLHFTQGCVYNIGEKILPLLCRLGLVLRLGSVYVLFVCITVSVRVSAMVLVSLV